MDLILVMKERLRDQNSETRAYIRHYMHVTIIGILLLGTGFYLHPQQPVSLFSSAHANGAGVGSGVVHVAGPNTAGGVAYVGGGEADGVTLSGSQPPTGAHGGLTVFVVCTVLGHISLWAALRSLKSFSTVCRHSGSWHSPVGTTRGAVPATGTLNVNYVNSPVGANYAPRSTSLPFGASVSLLQRFAFESAAAIQVLCASYSLVSVGWLMIGQVAVLVVYANTSHGLIAGTNSRGS